MEHNASTYARTRQRSLSATVERIAAWSRQHWLLYANFLLGFYLVSITAAPVIRGSGHSTLAWPIYRYFQFLCHQQTDRSFSIMGQPMAVCERCTGIYLAFFLGSLLFFVVRNHVTPLSPRALFAVTLPMAVDGLTQLTGLRESNWELRMSTGFLFGLGICWIVFPYVQRGLGHQEPVQTTTVP